MGMPEPNSPLWAAVKAIDDTWPPDDDVVAFELGKAWGRGADTVVAGAHATGRAGTDAVASWQDPVGDAFGGEVNEFTQAASRADQSMRDPGVRAEHYGRELVSAKTIITSTIAANENTYALMGNPLLGALGPQLQNAFASRIAADLRGMIDAKAAGLRAGQQSPVAPGKDGAGRNWLLGFLGDSERSFGDTFVDLGRVAGDGVNTFYDALGAAAGDGLRAIGLEDAGNSVEGFYDDVGNVALEGTLGVGATLRNQAYDAAQLIDGTDRPRTVYISRDLYPQAAAHIDDAKSGKIWDGFTWSPGEPKDSVLTVDRDGSAGRREEATSRLWPRPDYDRDEYPPAVAREGGKDSSVQYIDPRENRGSGSAMGHQLNGRTGSVERQLGGGPLGYGRADEDDKFTLETFG